MENEGDSSLACGQRGRRAENDRNTSTETQQAMDRSELRLEEWSGDPEANNLVQREKVIQNLPGSSRDGYEGSTRKQGKQAKFNWEVR